jgi:hypothetical protein
MADDAAIAVAALRERIGSLDDKIAAAHRRMDGVEGNIRVDLKEIYTMLATINSHIDQNKGSKAVWMLLASVFGGVIVAAGTALIKLI